MAWKFYDYFKSKIAFTFIIIALVFLVIALLGIASAWKPLSGAWVAKDLSTYMFITVIGKALVEPAVLAGIGFIIEYLYRIWLVLQRINNDASGKALFGSDDGKKG
ncbi:MAG: hypothetical protein JKY46_04795 [Robiginitomaculum sp.]|nr:hypothetical protein [Robiginitomaculum sp.]